MTSRREEKVTQELGLCLDFFALALASGDSILREDTGTFMSIVPFNKSWASSKLHGSKRSSNIALSLFCYSKVFFSQALYLISSSSDILIIPKNTISDSMTCSFSILVAKNSFLDLESSSIIYLSDL